MKIILSLFLIVVALHCMAQSSATNKFISGTYEYNPTKKYMGVGFSNVSLKLQKDGTFTYNEHGEMSHRHSSGVWQCKRDTLKLSSSPNINNIPFEVIESVSANQDSLKVGLVNNLDNELMAAIYYLNGDTNSQCEPLMETGCKLTVGWLDSFMLNLSYGAKTQWYHIKNKKVTDIKITINTHETFANFIFFLIMRHI